MNYIKSLLLSVFLSACSSTNEKPVISSSGLDPFDQSESERNQYKKAISFLNKNDNDTAKEIFLTFKSERPELAGPYANLAIIALKNNKHDEALDLVKIALTKNPNLPQALNLLAYFEQLNGDVRSAEKHYKEAIKNKNDYAIAHYNIALLYDVYLQDVERAIPYYEQYMKLINNNDKNTADWLEQLKRIKEKG